MRAAGAITSSQNAGNSNFSPDTDTGVGAVISHYRNSAGQFDLPAIARDLTDLVKHDLSQAEHAYQAVSQHLTEHGTTFDAANFQREVQNEFSHMSAGGLWAPDYRGMGSSILRENPMLQIRWEPTTSLINGNNGFSAPLRTVLENAGIDVVRGINPAPLGSLGPSAPGTTAAKNNINGAVARDVIADRYRNAGFDVNTEVNYDTATGRATDATRSADAVGDVRRVDVEVRVPGSRPELDGRILVESKVGYTTNSGHAAAEAVADAQLLRSNGIARGAGQALEGFGRVARPLGIALDVYSLGASYRADDNAIGTNTLRTASGITGSVAAGAGGAWAGAAAGAAIGSIVPGVGTVVGGAVGGIVGGIAGGIGGDFGGKALFDLFR